MARIRECPNCKQPVDDDNVFCVFCGAKIPDTAEAPVIESKGTGKMKKCPNGHEFADEKLDHCPVCGMPVTESAACSEEAWKCVCGYDNPLDNTFCQHCGKPKKSAGRSRPENSGASIPTGMYVPTDADLMRKKTRS